MMELAAGERAMHVMAFAALLRQAGYKRFPHGGLIAAKFGWSRRDAECALGVLEAAGVLDRDGRGERAVTHLPQPAVIAARLGWTERAVRDALAALADK